MKRRLLNVVTALSLLVCAAVCVLWVRSYLPPDFYLFSQQGRVMVVFAESTRSAMFSSPQGRSPRLGTVWDDARSSARVHWQALGLELVTGPSPTPPTATRPVPRPPDRCRGIRPVRGVLRLAGRPGRDRGGHMPLLHPPPLGASARGTVPVLRLRPPRHAGAVPGMR